MKFAVENNEPMTEEDWERERIGCARMLSVLVIAWFLMMGVGIVWGLVTLLELSGVLVKV